MSLAYECSLPIARTVDFQNIPVDIKNILFKHLQNCGFISLDYGWTVEILRNLLVGTASSLIAAEINTFLRRWYETKELRETLFPYLKNNSETIVGPRNPDTLKPSEKDIENAKKIKISNLFASCFTKPKIKTIDVEDLLKGFQTKDQEKIIKSLNVNCIGGPVPLPLTGWIIYNIPEIQFIYGPEIEDYYENKSLNPKGDRESGYEVDFCLIQKLPKNVLPNVDKSNHSHIYLFSGAHEEGTGGAIEILSNYEVLSNIEKKIGEQTPVSDDTFFEVAAWYNQKNNKFGVFDVHVIEI